MPARASPSAQLNINIAIQAIGNVDDLTAAAGASPGAVGLSWTEPFHPAGAAPFSYDVRVSTLTQIPNDAAFDAAAPLSAFSASAPPVPGAGGGAAGFVVAGLARNVTYYFAIREKDSVSLHGVWLRALSPPRNVDNFVLLSSSQPPPAGGAALTVAVSSLTAAWATASGATSYALVASTLATSPPTAVAASSTTAASTATLAGLEPNTTYFLFVSACGHGCSAFAGLGSTTTLAEAPTALSTTSVSSSTVDLVWSPGANPSGTPFRVQRGVDGVNFATALVSTQPAAEIAGLAGGGTYYFRVAALNGAGQESAPSNVVSLITPAGPVPSAPGGLSAQGGLLSAALSWDALPTAQRGAGLLYYALSRSTASAFGYVRIATTTATSFLDRPLSSGTTYFYKILARDAAGVDSTPSAPVAAVPFTERPMEPIGVTVAPSSASVMIGWTPTTRFIDGAPFVSTGAPTADELLGYTVYRSTDLCASSYVHLVDLPTTATSLTDATGGRNYYYRLFSFNSAGAATNAVVVSALGERDYMLDDCQSRLVINDQDAALLNGAANGIGDIRLVSGSRPQDVGGAVFQSGEWRAYLDGAAELKGYALPRPARVVLHFAVQNGRPAPSAAPVGAQGPAAGVADLGMYWFNGVQFQKMYGRVDAVAQTVSVASPNLGVYQVRALARSAGAVFDVSNLASRVITPNGDGRNDTLIFTYDPGPRNVVPDGAIFDLRGAFVSDMKPGLVANTLTWDGFMNGRPVAGGAYVYRIRGDGKTFTGTIVVAR